MRWWIWIVVAACGGSESGPPPKPPASPPLAIAATTCADVGAILRGRITAEDSTAGPAREAAIAAACTEDRWAPDLLVCIAQSRTPQACLDRLPPKLAASYQAHLAEWMTKYSVGELDDADDPPAAEHVVRHRRRRRRASSPDDVAVERDWVIDARKRLVLAECNARVWQESTKQCLISPDAPRDALASCMLLEASKDVFATQLAEISMRALKIAAAKQKPATITCARVVATYYADAEWKGALHDAKPAERTKAIAGSRSAMQKACSHDAWDDTLRACLVTGGGAGCFEGSTIASASAWGFPALGVGGDALPAECAEFRRLIEHYATCKRSRATSRDALCADAQCAEDQATRCAARAPRTHEADFRAAKTGAASSREEEKNREPAVQDEYPR